jgi:hypothetical protein
MNTKEQVTLAEKWAPVLEGIDDDYTRRVTAQLLENQAKAIIGEQMNEEANSAFTTTVGRLGTFQKFAFPLVRRVYPELIFNKLGAVQPMNGPVSQIFYLGHSRGIGGSAEQRVYSKYDLTYRSLTAGDIGSIDPDAYADDGTNADWTYAGGGSSGLDLDTNSSFELSAVLAVGNSLPTRGSPEGLGGAPSATVGGQIAGWPDSSTIIGYNVSAGESLSATRIPEISFNIEQQPVVARTRKMRALWTLEASQDLRAYHDLDLERELTELLSKEIQLEIDRELIEDLRMIAYDPSNTAWGGWDGGDYDLANSNNFGTTPLGPGANGGATAFVPAQFLYDFTAGTNATGSNSNVWAIDYTSTALPFAPQHVGHVYANLLAVINLAAQDIYTTTWRGPGSWILTSPLMCSQLESAAKLEGGIAPGDGPTNTGQTSIEYKGKFMGRYDMFVDPLYPSDEIMVGYKGTNAMDAGFVYSPYIPLQQLPTITDPETFQPRKGIMTRYGKAAITPQSRFYRIIRVVGPSSNALFTPFGKEAAGNNTVLAT